MNDLSWLSQDKVLCAVAKIFMLSFSFYGDAQLSNILRMRVGDDEQENSYSVFSEFVKKDFKGIITEMHNAIKGTICKDLDCVKVIEKYGKNSGKENGLLFRGVLLCVYKCLSGIQAAYVVVS